MIVNAEWIVLFLSSFLRILAIDDPKISQNLAFLGCWHKCIHGTPTIGSILKFESKLMMSGQASCIASILKSEIKLVKNHKLSHL